MNEMVSPRVVSRVAAPAATFILEAASDVRLGMPQLSGVGLSETWLLKDLADRHWMMLARAAGLDAPDFRDDKGHPVYAAFCAVRIEDARFDLARENGCLAIRSSIARVSRTQILSRHDLAIDDRSVGGVEMVSTFVKRTGGNNHSIARVPVEGIDPMAMTSAELPALAASFRAGRIRSHFGFDLSDRTSEGPALSFHPCPAQDFNGAGFLYFTSFLAFVDRAEWHLEPTPSAPITRREAFYYGNIDAGEGVRIVLAANREGDRFRWWQVRRDGTNDVLADVFVQRTRCDTDDCSGVPVVSPR